MNLKLTKHGESLALVLEDDLIELLQIDEETLLELTIEGHKLTISPKGSEPAGERFGSAGSSAGERYAKSFRRLAG